MESSGSDLSESSDEAYGCEMMECSEKWELDFGPPERKPFVRCMESVASNVSDTVSGLFGAQSDTDGICEPQTCRIQGSNDLEQIIDLQASSGAFKFGDVLSRLLEKSKIELMQAAKDRGCDLSTWLTVLVITYLEEEMPEHKDLWELVVAKSKKWLTTNGNEKELWTKAKDYISQ